MAKNPHHRKNLTPFQKGHPYHPPEHKRSLADHISAGGAGPISLQVLSNMLNASLEQLSQLIDLGYLRVLFRKESLPETTVVCPNPKVIDWLKQMFLPFELRPMIRLEEVHTMTRPYHGRNNPNNITRGIHGEDYLHKKVRTICLAYNIPIHVDPFFGEMMSLDGLQKFIWRLGVRKNPAGYDRTTLLAFLLNSIPHRRGNVKVPRYTAKLNREIRRIALLPIAQRTIMSMTLYEAWRDCRTIQECLFKLEDYDRYLEKDEMGQFGYKCGPNLDAIPKLEKKIQKLKKRVTEKD